MVFLRLFLRMSKKQTIRYGLIFGIVSSVPLITGAQSYTDTWTGNGTTWTANGCGIQVTTAVSGLQNGASVNFSNAQMGCNLPGTYASNTIVGREALAPFLDFGNDGKGVLSFTFNRPVTNPVLHLDRLGGGYGFDPRSNSALLTLITPNLSLERLTGNGNHFEVTPNTILRTPDALFGNNTTAECGIASVGGAAGSVRIMGRVTTVSFEFERVGASGSADAIEVVWEFFCDFDGDGVSDATDLDDDNDGILDIEELRGNANLDTDNDGLIDSMDLDSDGDGCFDVVESGFTDQDADGILGSLPNTVDASGLIIDENDGYTPPLDMDQNGTRDFQENRTPIILSRSPDMELCQGEMAVLSVSLANPVPLQWQISIDEGLTWINLVETNRYTGVNDEILEIYAVNKDEDNRKFRVQLESCNGPILSEPITLTVVQLPDAGIGRTVTLCSNDSPVNLMDLLEGSPDANGSWSPTLSAGNTMFDPGNDAAGTYTYRVEKGVCGSVSSEVIIEIIEEPVITDIAVMGFSDNNSISVTVDGDGPHEYSVNGFDYQDLPYFDGLEPGEYLVSVRNEGYCAVATEKVVVLGCPKFFTPNGDGNNDTWNIAGSRDIAHTLEIYDRYGKLLAVLDNRSSGWDGSYNGKRLPASDYWFKFSDETGAAKTGHFSLKR